jgi:hypothetical protein
LQFDKLGRKKPDKKLCDDDDNAQISRGSNFSSEEHGISFSTFHLGSRSKSTMRFFKGKKRWGAASVD